MSVKQHEVFFKNISITVEFGSWHYATLKIATEVSFKKISQLYQSSTNMMHRGNFKVNKLNQANLKKH